MLVLMCLQTDTKASEGFRNIEKKNSGSSEEAKPKTKNEGIHLKILQSY